MLSDGTTTQFQLVVTYNNLQFCLAQSVQQCQQIIFWWRQVFPLSSSLSPMPPRLVQSCRRASHPGRTSWDNIACTTDGRFAYPVNETPWAWDLLIHIKSTYSAIWLLNKMILGGRFYQRINNITKGNRKKVRLQKVRLVELFSLKSSTSRTFFL